MKIAALLLFSFVFTTVAGQQECGTGPNDIDCGNITCVDSGPRAYFDSDGNVFAYCTDDPSSVVPCDEIDPPLWTVMSV